MKLIRQTDCSIHKLPESVLSCLQSQITISSFQAAIRELLQNSLDANANEVIIKLDFRSLSVCVEDDGRGMRPEELEKVGKRYFTSKIDLLESLKDIETFGFRGEALHSIGCISRLSIISKHTSNSQVFKLKEIKQEQLACIYKFEEEISNYLENHFKFDPISQSGTIVTATSLFANVPVRRSQILKIPEHKLMEDVRQVILQSLIGRPNVKLTLIKLDLTSGDFQKTIYVERCHESELQARYATIFKSIYGHSLLSEYETVRANFQDYKLDGIIGLFPSQSKAFQYIFVNQRPLLISNEDSKYLNKIFVTANFGGMLTSTASNISLSPSKVSPNKQYTSKSFSRFPVFIINIQCPIIIEDLFQDPSKSIYYSNHMKLILNMLRNVFSSFLLAQGYECVTRDPSVSPSPSPSPKRQKSERPPLKQNISFIPVLKPSLKRETLKSTIDFIDGNHTPKFPFNQLASTDTQRFSANEFNLQSICYTGNNKSMNANARDLDLQETIIDKNDLIDGNYRIISQVDRKFILLVMPASNSVSSTKLPTILVVDQHACDERIRVEALFKDFILMLLDKTLGIELNKPLTFTASDREKNLFNSYGSNFESLGINYATNAEHKLIVTHLPHILIEKVGTDIDFLKSCLLQHLFDLEYHKKKVNISNLATEGWFQNVVQLPQVIIDCINSKACRSAIMFGDKLTVEEMMYLIKSLSECNQPFQCAHGRPSIVPLANIG